MQGDKLVLTDEKGGMTTVTIANVMQKNGVIHVIDTVLTPNEFQRITCLNIKYSPSSCVFLLSEFFVFNRHYLMAIFIFI
ncbi:MAG TPA: fasciclin domain-containing protein [Pedobacter sp.]